VSATLRVELEWHDRPGLEAELSPSKRPLDPMRDPCNKATIGANSVQPAGISVAARNFTSSQRTQMIQFVSVRL
jgi:hypothetical protein